MSNKMFVLVDGAELTLERVFNAPPALVFKAFSEAEHLKHWWGPRGWTLTVCEIDFRPGGTWHYCMKCEDRNQGDFYGMESWGKGLYHEIDEPDSFVYTDYFSDAEGNLNDSMPAARVKNSFLPHEGGTKLVSKTVYESPEALQSVIAMGMEQGITETWDRLEEYLQARV